MTPLLSLFFPLLLLHLHSCAAAVAASYDCTLNQCYILVKCTGKEVEPRSLMPATLLGAPEELHNFCKEREQHMIVEISPRSAHRFDFAVSGFPGTQLRLAPLLINATGVGTTEEEESEDYSIEHLSSSAPGADGIQNYRFTMEQRREINLLDIFRRAESATEYARGTLADGSGGRGSTSTSFAKLSAKIRCDPFDLVDYCTRGVDCSQLTLTTTNVTCERKLWFQNGTEAEGQNSRGWQWMDDVACEEGVWRRRRLHDSSPLLPSANGTFYCAARPPYCAEGAGELVLLSLLIFYCVAATALLIYLFSRFAHELEALRGPSKFKIIRVRGSREQHSKPSGSGSTKGSSSSSSEKDSGSEKKHDKQTAPMGNAITSSVHTARTLVSTGAAKQEKDKSGKTNIERLKSDRE